MQGTSERDGGEKSGERLSVFKGVGGEGMERGNNYDLI